MLVVGLTGGIGSGKSAAAKLFAELGAHVIDTDVIAAQLTAPGKFAYKEIVAHYGEKILQHQQLDRKQLREIIFTHLEEKQWLEALLHPLIKAEITKKLDKICSGYVIIVIPLLVESHFTTHIQRILVIDCPIELQKQRVLSRDDTSPEVVTAILSHQASREQRLQVADDVIVNDKTLESLEEQVNLLHEAYSRLTLEQQTT